MTAWAIQQEKSERKREWMPRMNQDEEVRRRQPEGGRTRRGDGREQGDRVQVQVYPRPAAHRFRQPIAVRRITLTPFSGDFETRPQYHRAGGGLFPCSPLRVEYSTPHKPSWMSI